MKLAVITNCMGCPNHTTKRTAGAGYALDHLCLSEGQTRKIKSYVEWPSEEPQDDEFPSWCPLKDVQ